VNYSVVKVVKIKDVSRFMEHAQMVVAMDIMETKTVITRPTLVTCS
jgi:hypothetical protein